MAPVTAPRVHLWTRDEYYRMAEAGLFEGLRVELIGGQVIEMSAMGTLHVAALARTSDSLRRVFAAGYWVRSQSPLDLGREFQPEPDVAVVTGSIADYLSAHPTTALLVVEVSDSSLLYDRSTKAGLYARAGLDDYWIVNLIDRHLEVYRTPEPDPNAPFGFRYRDRTVHASGNFVTPLAVPAARLAVADLLP